MEGESGSFELPLTSFGGRFGKGLDTPYDEFAEDDGISHQVEGGLKLVLGYEMQEDNSCRLTASIKQYVRNYKLEQLHDVCDKTL